MVSLITLRNSDARGEASMGLAEVASTMVQAKGSYVMIVEMIMMQLVSIFVNCMRWKVDELLPPQNIMVCAIKS